MVPRLVFPLLIFPALVAAQFVPPVPKGVSGDTTLEHRTIPFPAENQSWIRVRTPRFTIISSASERRTRDVAERLEALATSLGQVNERFDGRTIETRVLLFSRRRDSQPLFDLLLNRPRAEAPGVFVAQSDGSGTMVIDSGREWDRTLFHELTHNLLSGSGAHLPLWLEEGIAEYFSTAVIKSRHIILGGAISEHRRLLWSRTLIPLSEVFHAPRTSPLLMHTMFYPESWAAVEWMLRVGRPQFYRFLTDVEAGMSSLDALHKNYDVDTRAIERALTKPRSTPAATISVPVETVEGVIEISQLSRADSLFEIGAFLGTLDVASTDAERFFRKALDLEPAHARSLSGLGNLRARQKKYDEAFPFYNRAMSAAPDDPIVMLDYADALMRDMIGTFAGILPVGSDAQRPVRKARALATRALQHGGDLARANAIIGPSYLVERDASPGVAPLEKAMELKPARSDIALNLYSLYLRTGDRVRADALYERRFARTSNRQITLAAKTIFVQEQLAIANRFIAANDMAKAEALVKELADLTTDPVARMDLNNQLRKLQDVSAANVEIRSYNDAVAAANRGETKAAMKMVDEILAKAVDEKVLADAKRLREMLQWRIRREER